jgi:hypothetical protein
MRGRNLLRRAESGERKAEGDCSLDTFHSACKHCAVWSFAGPGKRRRRLDETADSADYPITGLRARPYAVDTFPHPHPRPTPGDDPICRDRVSLSKDHP